MSWHSIAFILLGFPIGALFVHGILEAQDGDTFAAFWYIVFAVVGAAGLGILLFTP